MNTTTITHAISARWLRTGSAIVGVLLIGGSIIVGLAHDTSSAVAPAASASTSPSRVAMFKQAQAEARDATYVPAAEWSSGAARFAAMKARQAEAREPLANTLAIPTAISGYERFASMKERQAERHDPTFVSMSAPALSSAERFAALKEQQIERYTLAVVPMATQTNGMERFAALKQAQAELREARSR